MERSITIDMMKGIAIILVIVGHWSVPEIVGRFIYAWHMPLFFMLSGFFFKVISFSKSFKKCVRSIVVPYMLSCAVIIILSLIDDTVNSKSIIWGALTGCPRALFESNVFFAKGYIHALWFLPALFICRIIYCLTPQINDWLKSLILGGVAYLGMRVALKFGHMPFGILQGLCAMLFYHLGFMANKYRLFNHVKNPFILFTALVFLALSINSGQLIFASCMFPNFCINVLGAISGMLLLYAVVCHVRQNRLLILFGQISLLILCVHAADMLLNISQRIGFHLSKLTFVSSEYMSLGSMMLFALGGGLILSKFTFVRKFMNLKQYSALININKVEI